MVGGLTQQRGSQVEDATITCPGVTVKVDKAERGEIQYSIREGGQLVVLEVELSGPRREGGGQCGGGERPIAAVHLTAVTGAKVGTCM